MHPLAPSLPVLLLVLSAGLAGCGGPEAETSWTLLPASELDEAAVAKRARASKARDALFGQLSSELAAALAAGGPEGAIGVCRDAAPRIAAEVSEAHDLRIGRTSFKLRNPENRPPAWAQEAVDARIEDDVFLVGDDGRLRALFPLGLMPKCLACHGDRDAMPEGLQARIAEAYPEDEAVGFEAGDLRGWFWVEVP